MAGPSCCRASAHRAMTSSTPDTKIIVSASRPPPPDGSGGWSFGGPVDTGTPLLKLTRPASAGRYRMVPARCRRAVSEKSGGDYPSAYPNSRATKGHDIGCGGQGEGHAAPIPRKRRAAVMGLLRCVSEDMCEANEAFARRIKIALSVDCGPARRFSVTSTTSDTGTRSHSPVSRSGPRSTVGPQAYPAGTRATARRLR
jgi:hypothetical protein